MNQQEKTEGIGACYVTMPVCRKMATMELSGDYTLPDYQPELRRLLTVSGRALPPAKYVGGGAVELDGTMEYQILYVGADGGLYSAPLTGEYSLHLPMENLSAFDLNEGVCVFATCTPESITARVTAPRKLSLRCRMKCAVGAYGRMPIGERLIGEVDPAHICRRTARVPSATLMSGRSDVIVIGDEIPVPYADVRVVGADAGVLVSEVSAGAEETHVRGEVVVKLLCSSEDGRMTNETRKIPFEGSLDTEAMTADGLSARVSGCVCELAVRVEDDKILCDAQIILEAHMGGNADVVYTADLYSTEKPCRTTEREYGVSVFLGAVTGNLSQSERMSAVEKGIPEGANVLDVYGSANLDACEARDGRYIVSGQSRYVFVCERDGEYSATEVLLPLRYETEGREGVPDWSDVRAEVISCRGRVSGDTLELDAELAVSGYFMGTETIIAPESADFSAEKKKKSGDAVLCYPAPDDTLWNVAKKYMVAPEDVEGDPENDPYVLIRE